jgi:hypothetical protein
MSATLRCYCPDDCNCRTPWRTNYCGCRQHALTLRIDKTGERTYLLTLPDLSTIEYRGQRFKALDKAMRWFAAAGHQSGTPLTIVENGKERAGPYFVYNVM